VVTRLLPLIILLGLIAAACQLTTAVTTTTLQEIDDAASDRIVVATTDGAVVVHDSSGAEIARAEPPNESFYRQPTWLDASTVVFSEVSASGDHSLSAMDADTGTIVWRAPMETPPFYFLPAPSESSYGLISELVTATGDVTPLSHQSPFYTSWSPDGTALAIHIVGQRLYIRTGESDTTIQSGAAPFQTPVWIDSGLVTLRIEGGLQRLTVWNDGSFTDVAKVEGPVGFVATGGVVAVQAAQRPAAGSLAAALKVQELPALPGGKLVVVDIATGSFETVSSKLALLYQWQANGERLLYATLGDDPLSVTWNVWSNGTSSEISTFTLQAPWFRNLVPFFDQYAQSIELWSSSGDLIGYPAVVDGQPVVILQPIAGGDPIVINGATWAAWAPPG